MSNYEDLFSDDALDQKMTFLDEKKQTGKDGLYRVDLSKVMDKKRGYVATIRFLPNLTQAGSIGPSAIEKVTHYVDTKQVPELAGYYDSPKNLNPETGSPFSDKCALTECFWSLKNSKNAILQEKANMLNYSKKYFSYVLVVEDEQQRENVGKIMIYQYGKTIKDKIAQERNGDISGVPCNIFSLQNGKDLRLIVKEVQDDRGNTFPDYRMCQFMANPSSVSLPTSEGMKAVPLTDGKISADVQGKIKDFMMGRDHNLEDFGPRELSEEQQSKVSQIINYLTGRASATVNAQSEPATDDFTFDDVEQASESASTTTEGGSDDDFDFEF